MTHSDAAPRERLPLVTGSHVGQTHAPGTALVDGRPLDFTAFLRFLLPLMPACVLPMLVENAKGIFLGQLLGPREMAAAAIFAPVINSLIAFMTGFGYGIAILIGHAHGAKDYGTVRSLSNCALYMTAAAGLLLVAVGMPLLDGVIALLNTPPELVVAAKKNAAGMLLAAPGMMVTLALISMIRGCGDLKLPLFMLGTSSLATLVLCPALMLGWLGFPKVGILASSLATLLADAVTLAIFLPLLSYIGHPIALHGVTLGFLSDARPMSKVLRFGALPGLQYCVGWSIEMWNVRLLDRFGQDATISYAAITQIWRLVSFPAVAVGVATSILAAHAVGGGQAFLLPRIRHIAAVCTAVLSTLLVIIACVFAGTLVAWFVSSSTPLRATVSLLRSSIWAQLPLSVAQVFASVLEGSGDITRPSLLCTSVLLVVQVPGAYLLAHYLGQVGVWYSYPLGYLAVLMSIMIYSRRVRLRRSG